MREEVDKEIDLVGDASCRKKSEVERSEASIYVEE